MKDACGILNSKVTHMFRRFAAAKLADNNVDFAHIALVRRRRAGPPSSVARARGTRGESGALCIAPGPGGAAAHRPHCHECYGPRHAACPPARGRGPALVYAAPAEGEDPRNCRRLAGRLPRCCTSTICRRFPSRCWLAGPGAPRAHPCTQELSLCALELVAVVHSDPCPAASQFRRVQH